MNPEKIVAVYNMEGRKSGNLTLPAIFSTKMNSEVIWQALRYLELKSKNPIAHTKTRADRRGGGRKPWRQKGTGRARAGSIRSPLWRKGGVTFGPRSNRNYEIRLPKKMRQSAVAMLLSSKADENKVIVLNKLVLSEIKTKDALNILQNLPIDNTVLIAIAEKDETLQKSFRNMDWVKVVNIQSLNAYDISKYAYLLLTRDGVLKIGEKNANK
jgi:large subunit ribosomal protein L4